MSAKVWWHTSPFEAFATALESNAWTAGAGGGIVLTGSLVDRHPSFVTRLFVLPGSVTAETRLPILVPEESRRGAERLSAALNRFLLWGVVSIAADGAPIVTSKAPLCPPDEVAAAAIASRREGQPRVGR